MSVRLVSSLAVSTSTGISGCFQPSQAKVVLGPTPLINLWCMCRYTGHKDGVWDVAVSRLGLPVVGTVSADHTAKVSTAETDILYRLASLWLERQRPNPKKNLVYGILCRS